MNPDDYHLEFYDDGSRQPVRDWLEDLEQDEPAKHDALMYGLSVILARQGINVCGTEFGKNLGKGLYEFRLRHTRDELQAKTQPHLNAKQPEGDPEAGVGAAPEAADGSAAGRAGADPTRLVLRVFFSVHGDKIVLLLGGYDKGKDPSPRRQNKEIAEARKRLKAHQAEMAADAKQAKHAAKGAAKAGSSSKGPESTDPGDPTLTAEQRVPAGRSYLLWFRKRRQRGARGTRPGR